MKPARKISPRRSVSAFVDILGFADTTLAVESADDLISLEKKVRVVQDAFEYNSKDEHVRENHSLYRKSVLAFSDCVVINLPLRSAITETQGTFDPIMSELVSLAWAQCTCVFDGIFLRGGISFGWWYRSGARLVSSSLVHAYRREQATGMPVLALTPELFDYLSRHKHRSFYAEDVDPIRATFEAFIHPVSKEKIYFLDYLTIWLGSVDWATSRKDYEEYLATIPELRQEIMDRGYERNVKKSLIFHKEAVERALEVATKDSVREKYQWLAGYHNRIAKRYTKSKECQIDG
jgi:ketosteroid isomerase-like protein